MNNVQVALARHHTYVLLSRILLEGVSPSLVDTVRQVPELAFLLPAFSNSDEAQAAHFQLFGLNVFPYESIFLGTDGLLGGTVTDGVQAVFREVGYVVKTDAVSPDHFGFELGLMAFLCQREAQAWEQGNKDAEVRWWQQQQRDFLQSHIFCWVWPLAAAIRQQEQPIYQTIINLSIDLLVSHFDSLQVEDEAEKRFSLPTPPDLINNKESGLRDIVKSLLTPPFAGIYFSRDDIRGFARQLDIPCGFGSKEQMLLNLMRTAAQYEQMPAFLTILRTMLNECQKTYNNNQLNAPKLAQFIHPWQERIESTMNMIQDIVEATKVPA